MNIPKFFRSGAHSAEKKPQTTTGTMLDVIIALIPAAFAGVSVFGFRAAALIALCIVSCVLAEYLWEKLMKRPNTTGDLTAVVTGLLLSFSLPVSAPLWICPIGAVIAIIFAKQLFGGAGKSFLNPAITARIVLLLIFAGGMSSFTEPSRNPVDALSAATPLVHLNAIDLTGNVNMQLGALISDGEIPNIINMLFGVRAGCIGETCAPALILGAVYLALRGVISLTLPLVYIGTTALILLTASGFNVLFTAYELLGGALLLGAFFMATDPSTTPKKLSWKLIFGAAAGIITVLIRFFTPLPEGVAYSVLLMNVACIFTEKKSIKLYVKPEEPLAGDDDPGITTDSTPEQNAAEAPDESLVGDDAPGVPHDSTTEQHAVAAKEEATETSSDETIPETLVGDVAHGVPTDSTAEQHAVTAAEEATETSSDETAPETLVGDDAPGVPPDSTPEQNAAEAPDESIVGDDAPGVPHDSTTEQHAVTAAPAKPVLINTLSDEPRFEPASMQKNKKKLGRKAKKQGKVMPDFNSPLPDVIPAFLKKDIENNKQSDN